LYEYTFPKNAVVNEDRLEIDIPKAREIKLKTPKRSPEIQDSGDRRVYTWVVKGIEPDRDKAKDKDDDAEEETGPDVQLTTFTDWKQIAEWYAKLQGERMTVDDSVRKKADELTKGATTLEEKARRLYDYVALDIRYVSISLGIGRFQPHAASEVLESGYGDCKDKHTLLAAMLKVEGIQSYPVLIDSSRKLDVDVPSPAQFDHVFTLADVGSTWTWLDSTQEVTPYGLILYQLRNKQAVVASGRCRGRTAQNSLRLAHQVLRPFRARRQVHRIWRARCNPRIHCPGRSRLADARGLPAHAAGPMGRLDEGGFRAVGLPAMSIACRSILSRTHQNRFT